MITAQLIAADFNFTWSRSWLPVKLLFLPFHVPRLRSKSLSSATLKVKGLELHLLEGGLSKDLWASVKSITVISKFGRCYFEAVLISFFS